MHTFLIVIQILMSLLLMVVVLMQPSKTQGFGNVITGNTDTFYSRNKVRTKESVLANITVFSAIVFAVVTIALNIVK